MVKQDELRSVEQKKAKKEAKCEHQERVEADGRGSGSRRDQGACGKVRCHVQAGCLYTSFKCLTLGIAVFGGRVKILCSNKTCEKKIHYCLVWGFSNDL